MAKQKMVKCRYPKCSMMHATTEMPKDEAYADGKGKYYHPDCYHTMQTVNQIRDLFYKEINPMMTGQQIGQLVSIVNNMIFSKHIDVDMILFSLQYFIKNKPGKLRYPGGMAYIVQDRDVLAAWERKQKSKIKSELQGLKSSSFVSDEFTMDDLQEKSSFVYKPQKQTSFADILK